MPYSELWQCPTSGHWTLTSLCSQDCLGPQSDEAWCITLPDEYSWLHLSPVHRSAFPVLVTWAGIQVTSMEGTAM